MPFHEKEVQLRKCSIECGASKPQHEFLQSVFGMNVYKTSSENQERCCQCRGLGKVKWFTYFLFKSYLLAALQGVVIKTAAVISAFATKSGKEAC